MDQLNLSRILLMIGTCYSLHVTFSHQIRLVNSYVYIEPPFSTWNINKFINILHWWHLSLFDGNKCKHFFHFTFADQTGTVPYNPFSIYSWNDNQYMYIILFSFFSYTAQPFVFIRNWSASAPERKSVFSMHKTFISLHNDRHGFRDSLLSIKWMIFRSIRMEYFPETRSCYQHWVLLFFSPCSFNWQ